MVASREGAIKGRGVPPDIMGFPAKRFAKGRGKSPALLFYKAPRIHEVSSFVDTFGIYR